MFFLKAMKYMIRDLREVHYYYGVHVFLIFVKTFNQT